ncbi:kinase-like protein [Sistotremastrum niveocremeum HHB9708]|uniref:Kinase-like protein n=1 Tax=Sistotremastrum niveocremeum HHB9708 TaxID=1314777 RepID=A0A164T911_9AGAM|nr:kinase-like protein [Sistotremastrum niveocremeum HHB9708]
MARESGVPLPAPHYPIAYHDLRPIGDIQTHGEYDTWIGQLTGSTLKVLVKRFNYKPSKYQGTQPDPETVHRRFSRELAVVSRVRHPNIVEFIGMVNLTQGEGDRSTALVLLFEHLQFGNLRNYLNRYSVDVHTRLSWILDVAEALRYLHSLTPNAVIHNNINSSQILIGDNGVAKLDCFTHSREIYIATSTDWVDNTQMSSFGLEWPKTCQAPETLPHWDDETRTGISGVLSKASDVYSWGLTAVSVSIFRRRMAEHELSSLF